MIFVTVGTQLPFERMLDSVNKWLAKNIEVDCIGQVGPTDTTYEYIRSHKFMSVEEIDKYYSDSDLIIAHAGMGSILTALYNSKPIIIMPRVSEFGEHRNEHQVHTAKVFSGRSGVSVVMNEKELINALDLWKRFGLEASNSISKFAPDDFLENIKKIISF